MLQILIMLLLLHRVWCLKQNETHFVGTRLRMDTTQALSVAGILPSMGAAGERPEFDIMPPLGASVLIFPKGYLLNSFPHGDTSKRLWGFEIRILPLPGELPRLSNLTCPFASYTASNSVPTCGLRL